MPLDRTGPGQGQGRPARAARPGHRPAPRRGGAAGGRAGAVGGGRVRGRWPGPAGPDPAHARHRGGRPARQRRLRAAALPRAGAGQHPPRRPARRRAARRSWAPRRAFYTSRDTADDLDAVRRALGVSKLSLYGVSYGTRTATAYALRYPARVERLGLDSVTAVDGADALSVDSFRAVPRVLRALCAGRRCDRFSRDPVADVATLVQRIGAARPAEGRRCPTAAGRPRAATLSRYDVFSTLVSGDFEASLRDRLPGGGQGRAGRRPGAAAAPEAAVDRAGERRLRARGAQHRPVRRHHLRGGAAALAARHAVRPAPAAGCGGRRGDPGAGADRPLRRRHRPGLRRDRPVLAVARVAARPDARPGPAAQRARAAGGGRRRPAHAAGDRPHAWPPGCRARRWSAWPAWATRRARRGSAAAPSAWPPASSPAGGSAPPAATCATLAPTGVPPRTLKGLRPVAAVGATIDDVVDDVAFAD